MHFASNYAYIDKEKPKEKKKKAQIKPEIEEDVMMMDESSSSFSSEEDLNLNVFVVTFEGIAEAEKQLAGGDPYNCKTCGAILNKHSKVIWPEQLQKVQMKMKIQLGKNQAFWQCQFCSNPNIIKIQKEQIPKKDDIVYMMEGEQMQMKNQNQSTLVFCIDTSGSMNSTTAVEGKVDLKYGLSSEQIEMLKQFMEPGDQAQFNFLPGHHNKNKTFISRKQCILSAIESQIHEIKKTYPFKKIGFVTFSNQVVALGDTNNQTVHIVGDKLSKEEAILNSLTNFKITDHIAESEKNLLNSINKIDAKGSTALGPAIVTAINIAEKGYPGSSVILCTDGLANIGIGQLQPYDEEKKKFYSDLGERAKQKNITVNIITIKGEGCKVEAIGQLAEKTNGNIKIVNPEKLSEDFANVLKDEVVGLNVSVRVLLHKGMRFRNQAPENIKEEGCLLQKVIANATKNTRVSFQYDVKRDEELQQLKIDLKQLKTVPFQAQIEYTSPTGGKFLRVISSICDTTESKEQMSKQANLGVVHHRITNQTAALYKGGDYKASQSFNRKWDNYLGNNFKEKKFAAHQNKFSQKNQRLNKAIRHKHKKSIQKKKELEEVLSEEELQILDRHSYVSSDSDQKQLVENLMERQCFSIKGGSSSPRSRRSLSQQSSGPKQRKKSIKRVRSKKQLKKVEKEKEEKPKPKQEKRKLSPLIKRRSMSSSSYSDRSI